MGTRNRRIYDKGRAAARQRNMHRDNVAIDVGRTRPVRFAYALNCLSCGYSHADEVIAPSSAPAGAQVEITTSCTCGGETHGIARVSEVLGS